MLITMQIFLCFQTKLGSISAILLLLDYHAYLFKASLALYNLHCAANLALLSNLQANELIVYYITDPKA